MGKGRNHKESSTAKKFELPINEAGNEMGKFLGVIIGILLLFRGSEVFTLGRLQSAIGKVAGSVQNSKIVQKVSNSTVMQKVKNSAVGQAVGSIARDIGREVVNIGKDLVEQQIMQKIGSNIIEPIRTKISNVRSQAQNLFNEKALALITRAQQMNNAVVATMANNLVTINNASNQAAFQLAQINSDIQVLQDDINLLNGQMGDVADQESQAQMQNAIVQQNAQLQQRRQLQAQAAANVSNLQNQYTAASNNLQAQLNSTGQTQDLAVLQSMNDINAAVSSLGDLSCNLGTVATNCVNQQYASFSQMKNAIQNMNIEILARRSYQYLANTRLGEQAQEIVNNVSNLENVSLNNVDAVAATMITSYGATAVGAVNGMGAAQ